MKSIYSILLAFVLVLLTTTLNAQNQFGMRMGSAVTTFADKGDLLDNTHVTWSYTAGAFYDVSLSKSFSIQPEINYVRKGRNDETSELNATIPTDYMLHYLQVPVLFQYRDANSQAKSGSFFYINAGPYAAIALGDQMRPSNSVQTSESSKTDWGATFGVGYQTPICKKDIRFDLRYDMGLSSVANQPDDFHSKALSLTVGIAF
jgi:hypothetical protein